MNFLIFFYFTQFWLDGRPGNEYFWISHKISGHLTPKTPLGVHPQWFKTTWNRYERFLLLCARLAVVYLSICASHMKWLFSSTTGMICRSYFNFSACFSARHLYVDFCLTQPPMDVEATHTTFHKWSLSWWKEATLRTKDISSIIAKH